MLLIAGADADAAAEDDGATPMGLAALNNHAGVVADLLRAGADVNRPNFAGATPLLISAEKGNTEVVSLCSGLAPS